ncbi:MAG: DUF63 family protein [Methanoregula sp.]|jgi:uncharacterized membrane protein|uniref:DUF63 family protein n=1 Tax=Methanoregula sp. TaxID=2052170 RepID=UPI003C70F030
MISDFIYKYYIDPVKYGEPYNIVETLTYAIILIIGVYLLYRWFSNSTWLSEHGIKLDSGFILATIPYVVLGGVLRVIQDAGMVTGDWQYLIVTPPIYFVLFFFVLGMIFLGGVLKKNGLIKNFLTFYAFIGCIAVFVISLILLSWGMVHGHVDLFILSVIPLMAITSTVLVWACMRYILKWEYVSDPLFLVLIFGQMLDASATSYGLTFHPAVHYIEQHVVGSNLIEMTGTAFIMYPLKLVVLFPAIYIMQLYRKEANPTFWHLVLLAMIVVGLAPGVRDMIRMVLYV